MATSPSSLKRVWRDYLQPQAFLVVLAAALMAVDGGSLGLLTYYVKPMIDDVFIAVNENAIKPIAAILFGIFALRAIAAFFQRTLTAHIGLVVVAKMQAKLSAHLMSLDGLFYSKNSPGSLLERVRGDTQTIQLVAANALIILGRDSVSLVALIAVALYIDWQWTLVAFIGAPLVALPINMLHKVVRRATLKSRVVAADLSNRLDEIFHGIKAIKANRMEDHESERTAKVINDFRRRSLQAEAAKAAMPSLVDIVAGLGFVAVMVYGGQEIVSGEKTLGDFMSFFAALGLLFDPIRRLAGVGGQLQAAGVSLDRIYELMDEQPRIVDTPTAGPLTNPQGAIRFDQVCFRYSDDRPVLDNLTIEAQPGKVTAIIGPSGAGKSTLFNLLCRFEQPQSGQITIGGQPLEQIRIADLRDNLALVTQETALFDESIYQNIACGKANASTDEVLSAAVTALVNEFVEDMPDGLQSLAGPRGSNLSGGQRQRVVIARALLRNAPILLLDEATSALDSKTEQRIQLAMETILKDRTAIVIAHRLSTIRKADKIYVMEHGQIIESGTHEQLLAGGGRYAGLLASLEE